MKADIRIGWTVVALLMAVALCMALSALVHAAPRSLTDNLVAVQSSLQSRSEEPVDARELADAITSVTHSPQWAALLLTTAHHESALSARIARSEYKPHEGDHGKAWGLFQNWKSASNANVWGSPDIAVQVKAASHLTRQYYNMCRNSGVPFPLSTMRALSGRGCSMPLKGEAQRMHTYQSVLARLQ